MKTTVNTRPSTKVFPMCIFLLAVSNSVHAVLEEIVVTAQKREQNVNDIPITINAFSGERLQELGMRSAEDMALHTPGLTVNETAATGTPLYSIRGVGFQDYSTAATSTVGLNFDEVNIPYSVMTRGAIFDVQRVEVLKGPQGDLFGRNTTAGQINFVSNQPTEELEAGFSAGYSSYNTLDFEGFISGPMSDQARGRVAYRTTQAFDGWQKNILDPNDEKLGEKDVHAVRGIVDLDISKDATITLNAQYVKDDSDNQARTAYDPVILGGLNNPYMPLGEYLLPGGGFFGQPVPWFSTGDNEVAGWDNTVTQLRNGVNQVVNNRPVRDNELFGISAKLTWQIGGIELTSITAYNEFDRNENNQWDSTPAENANVNNQTDIELFSQELRLSGETETITWLVGLYYSDDKMNEVYHYTFEDSEFGIGATQWLALDPGGAYTNTVLANSIDGAPSSAFAVFNINELETRYTQESESFAVFGNVEWTMAEDWRVILGVRYTDESRSIESCTYDAGDGSYAGLWNGFFGATLQPGDCAVLDDIPTSPNFILTQIGNGTPNNAFHTLTHKIGMEKAMFRAVIDYTFNNENMIYASFSTGFKSGGFNGANLNTSTQFLPYEKEKLTAYQIGTKMRLHDGRMQLNASAFYYDYKDKQETDLAVALVGNISGLTNVPESELYGVDLDITWQPTDPLFIYLGVAWLKTEIERWDAVDNSSTFGNVVTFDASGNDLPMAPQWQINSTISYDWNLANGYRLTLGGDYSFKDETKGIRLDRRTEDYWVMNGRLSLTSPDDKWRATLWSRNITDEYYYPAAHSGGGVQWSRVVGMPRTVGFTVDYNF